MNILFATTEATPFCKTGGLGDVCGALPVELSRRGQNCTVIMPAFRQALRAGLDIRPTDLWFQAPVGSKMVGAEVLESRLPESDVPVYLIKQDQYYDRPELYRDEAGDYRDNCERFVFFARAVLETIRLLDLQTNVLHCHDWQAGLLPAYLRTLYAVRPPFDQIATLFTIHNLAYQGVFWHWDMELTGIGWEHFNYQQLEFYGKLNFMKSGLTMADVLSTVSPRYAEEIQEPPMSCGMEGVLAHRADELFGVLNGVDYDDWNPATDAYLAANYGPSDWHEGKAVCKAALQHEMGLPANPETPLLASVGRLADQKGFDLIADVLPRYARDRDAQWVLLGTGEPKYHELLSALAAEFPGRVAVELGFSNELAHRIEAGADMFLMPSRYEPCGLNQMYSLKYGTPPIVRETGGLADTITGANDHTLASGEANGFSFADASPYALSMAIDRALEAYRDPAVWTKIVDTGMRQDWSWGRSADRYIELYEHTHAAAMARKAAVVL
ncbi:MAG: glycogen synthase GlgA [Planctomycetota bacterium]